jgi:hypothetical protein
VGEITLSIYYPSGKVPGQSMRGSFWWRTNLKLLITFKGIANVKFGIGDTILF